MRDVPASWLSFFEFTGDVANVGAAAMLDAQTGTLTSGAFNGKRNTDKFRHSYGTFAGTEEAETPRAASSGGASRFFYCAKVSRAERNAGLDGFPLTKSADEGYGSIQTPKLDRAAPRENWQPHRTANNHPTVKPIALMRWLTRLVTPPGGLILDPFGGSGSTGCAAELEGFPYILVEREADYMRIIEARTAFWREHGEDGLRICAEREAGERKRVEVAETGQIDIFAALDEAA